MIEVSARLRCNVCNRLAFRDYWSDEEVPAMLRTAEGDGWKVNRLARDAYYGKAWCPTCREDRCGRCNGRGYYANFKNWDSYHGEPERKECEECDGKGH